jgi:tetratricopeptide (TPR) repeat protein
MADGRSPQGYNLPKRYKGIAVILTLWGIFSLPAKLFQRESGVMAAMLPERAIAQPPLATRIAAIMPKTDIAQLVKTLSVLIQSPAGSGSGVIIQRQGKTYTVATAAHVVATPNIPYTLTLADDHAYTAANVKRLSGVDLAIVTFQSDRDYPVAVLGSSQILGEGSPVYVAGFPLGTAVITRSIYTFTEGTLTARSSKPFSDGYAMVYSNNTLPGMSGGGVFNQLGQLVGIHGRGDVDNKLEASSINPDIVIKTGFNLGIPIERLVGRREAIGLKIAITPSSRPISVSTGDDRVVAATIKAQQGDYNGAIADISLAIAQSPKAANLYFARANYAMSMGQSDVALQDLDRAIQLNPQSESAFWIRGNYRQSLNDKTGAIADFTQVIRLNPTHLQAYAKRAYVYGTQPNPAQAIADFTSIIKLAPQNKDAYEMRATWRSTQGDYKGALADYAQVIQLNPKNANAYLQRGKVRQALKDIEGAIADYKAALKIEPQNKMFYDALAYLEKERNPTAFNNERLKTNPKDLEALQIRARDAFKHDDYAQAIADYSSILKIDSKNEDARSSRAEAYLQSKRFDYAISDYSALIQSNPQSPKYYKERAGIYWTLGEIEKEIADYQTIARLYRDRKDARNIKDSEERIERLNALIKRFAELTQRIKQNPDNPWRYWERGLENSYFKTARGDFEKAKELFRQRGNIEQVRQCETFIKGIECDLKGTSCEK